MSKSKIWCLGLLALILTLSPVETTIAVAPGSAIPKPSQMVEQDDTEQAERDALRHQQEVQAAEAEAQAALQAQEEVTKHQRLVTSLSSYSKLETDVIEYLVKGVQDKQLPLSLVAGLIDLESSWDASNRNESSGATGLGQIMPRTARSIVEGQCHLDNTCKYDLSYYQRKLKDPYFNIDMTLAALDNLRNAYGNWDKVLTAYNRGDQGLKNWMRDKGTPVSVYSKVVKSRATTIEDMIGAL